MTEIFEELTENELNGNLDEEHYEYLCSTCHQPIDAPNIGDERKIVSDWGSIVYGCKNCDAVIEGFPLKKRKKH